MEADLSLVSHGEYVFVICNAPTDKNVYQYAKKLKNLGVSTIVRVCEPTYSAEHLVDFNIQLEDHPFSDGAAPPPEIISRWLDILDKQKKVAVHCVAGLGRAPVLVVIALIEFAQVEPLDAIQIVRSERRGAINRKQLQYLTSYKRTRKKKKPDCCCLL